LGITLIESVKSINIWLSHEQQFEAHYWPILYDMFADTGSVSKTKHNLT